MTSEYRICTRRVVDTTDPEIHFDEQGVYNHYHSHNRQVALDELEKPTYSPAMQEEDRSYVTKKLGLTEAEFEEIMRLPKRSYWDFPSYKRIQNGPLLGRLTRGLRKVNRWRRQRQQAKRS